MELSDFYHNKKGDKIWWVNEIDGIGKFLFSFDKKKIYSVFEDYPHKMTKEEKELFDKENPELSELLIGR